MGVRKNCFAISFPLIEMKTLDSSRSSRREVCTTRLYPDPTRQTSPRPCPDSTRTHPDPTKTPECLHSECARSRRRYRSMWAMRGIGFLYPNLKPAERPGWSGEWLRSRAPWGSAVKTPWEPSDNSILEVLGRSIYAHLMDILF